VSELPFLALEWPRGADPEQLISHEWLVTNGLGGYASGTVAGCNTRRHHGLFVPTLPGFGRTVVLPRLQEVVTIGDERFRLDGEETVERGLECPAALSIRSFQLEGLVPRWEHAVGGARLRRRLVMVHGQNTLFAEYAHLSGPDLALTLRLWPAFRVHDQPLPPAPVYATVRLFDHRVELSMKDEAPPLRVRVTAHGPVPFIGLSTDSTELVYRTEQRRGLDDRERLRSPGYFKMRLREGDRAYLALTMDEWECIELQPAPFFDLEAQRERRLLDRAPERARTGMAARLVLAADQFLIDPSVRPADATWAKATGQDARSVIAGYHWFTDWGRDTMISLDGLTLHTGRPREAAAILRTFQHYVRDGLLPNLFPEGEHEGLYHTADATLWFFHAIDRYLAATDDEELLRDAFPTLEEIVTQHVRGTRYGIRIDPADGLFTQGEEGYQLTWMDAKVNGWVVTPRRGKAVELNALWFNAMRLMEAWASRLQKDPRRYTDLAEQAQRSFNARFWNPAERCLFDVVDAEGGGDDPALRPNQIFSLSLRNPVLARDRWSAVVDAVERELLTPFGLRTLSPKHPAYKRAYHGDLRSRDAAYHQGTVWPWLIGHFIDAWLKVHGDRGRARGMLAGLEAHLREDGTGQMSEIFDAESPFVARGCIAQAWSVAEVLRSWIATEPDAGAARS
jgi:predicted glycogen debranching enzyme